jgi:adenylate kinase family enzyme
MKLVILFGPQAVGKMTVGQELAKVTELKLFHNHMTIDLVNPFFNYGTKEGKRLVKLFRQELFEAMVKSDLYGVIFTYVWAFDLESDCRYIEELSHLVESNGGTVYWVELEADVNERLYRNKTPNRLTHKPTKQNLDHSEKDLLNTMNNYRLNSNPGEIKREHYLKIDNTYLSSEEVANMIKERFSL